MQMVLYAYKQHYFYRYYVIIVHSIGKCILLESYFLTYNWDGTVAGGKHNYILCVTHIIFHVVVLTGQIMVAKSRTRESSEKLFHPEALNVCVFDLNS